MPEVLRIIVTSLFKRYYILQSSKKNLKYEFLQIANLRAVRQSGAKMSMT